MNDTKEEEEGIMPHASTAVFDMTNDLTQESLEQVYTERERICMSFFF